MWPCMTGVAKFIMQFEMSLNDFCLPSQITEKLEHVQLFCF